MKTFGIAVCWGARPEWSNLPIENIPAGGRVVKRRIRSDSVALAFVKLGDSIQKHKLSPFKDGQMADGNSNCQAFLSARSLWLLPATAVNARR